MRILFLTSKFNFESGGGSSPELDAKIRMLQNVGHDVSVVTAFSQRNKPFLLPYPVHEERLRNDSAVAIQREIFRLLKKYAAQADVIYTEGQFGFGAGAYRLFGGRVPVTIHFNRELSSFPETRRGMRLSFKRRIRFFLETVVGFRLINRADLFTFTSPVLRDLYVHLGLDRKKTVVVPDFFDTTENIARAGTTDASAARRSESKTSLLIFCTGRFVEEKGFDVMLRAFARLSDRSRFRLCISGDGPERERLAALASELGITSSVTFPGWVSKDELDAWYRQADIFVIPRWRPELTSMLVFEAMSFALPCIVVRDSAIAWQTQDAALFFRDEDDAELAVRIQELADHPELRASLAKKGFARLAALDQRRIIGTLDAALRDLNINAPSKTV